MEIVGLITSSVALAEVIAKVGKGIINLKRMWDEVKDVPTTIQTLFNRLDNTFIVALQAAQDLDLIALRLLDNAALRICNFHCKTALGKVNTFAYNLSASIDPTKKFKIEVGGVQVALEKAVLTRYEKKFGGIIQLSTLVEAANYRRFRR
ncbi:hypothetical protein ACHAQA_009672 [Verticillium albo-atrum]